MLLLAIAKSVSGYTAHDAMPPNSRHTDFLPAKLLSIHPTFSEPVKLKKLMRSSFTSFKESSLEHGNTEKASFGSEVCLRISANFKAQIGVLSDGLMINGHPAAIAGATLCAMRLIGKLKGVMKVQRPFGKRLIKHSKSSELVCVSIERISPSIFMTSIDA